MPAKGKKPAAPTKMTIVEPKGVEKKKGAAAQKGEKKNESFKKRLSALFQSRPKDWTLGVTVPHKRDLTHFVAWPHYVRLARQKRILLNRLKCPPAINMFRHSLDKSTVVELFKLMAKMRPEEEAARRKRRVENAKRLAEVMKPKEGEKVDEKARRAAHRQLLKEFAAQRPAALRFGLNNVTHLVTRNKAQLVVIASDVDPIELVLWLPALCRKKKVPYCIVKNKARLGQLVHHKTASVVAFTDVPKELRADFDKLVDAIKPQFLENTHLLREWGEPVLGLKHNAREAKRLRRIARIEAQKK